VLSISPGARAATGRTEAKRLVLLLLPALGVSERIRRFYQADRPRSRGLNRI